MRRAATTTAILLALAAWAGAQGPRAALSAADRVQMHRANKTLLTDLVNNGIALGTTDNAVGRVEACQATARAIGVALCRAAEADDGDRVVELGSHLELVVRDGLTPMLDETKLHISKESPEYVRLKKAQENAAANLDESIATAGKLGGNANVRTLTGKLGELREKLK
ncbi:MAG TPA: hypothetical protein VGI99_14210 [Gemmataceae bacterium]|jgi:hypothetical protein